MVKEFQGQDFQWNDVWFGKTDPFVFLLAMVREVEGVVGDGELVPGGLEGDTVGTDPVEGSRAWYDDIALFLNDFLYWVLAVLQEPVEFFVPESFAAVEVHLVL